MIQKKICMLGSFAVGKTSLVRRFVHSMFTDKYLTTVGVKIDNKKLVYGDKEVSLLLWDLYGEDEFQRVQTSYLRGSSGLLLVADGTRPETVDKAIELNQIIGSKIIVMASSGGAKTLDAWKGVAEKLTHGAEKLKGAGMRAGQPKRSDAASCSAAPRVETRPHSRTNRPMAWAKNSGVDALVAYTPTASRGTSTPSETIRTATSQVDVDSENALIRSEAVGSSESTTVGVSPVILRSRSA